MGDGQTSRRYRKDRNTYRTQCATNNTPCWICGQPINYQLPWKDPHTGQINDNAFELDHLYPRSTHPQYAEDPGNYRPTHRACNRQRSNKTTLPQIGQNTRQWTKTP